MAKKIDEEAKDVREAIEGKDGKAGKGGSKGRCRGGGSGRVRQGQEEAADHRGGRPVLLLGGGGAAAYFLLGHKPAEEAPVAAEPAIPVEADPILVTIERVTAPMTSGGTVNRLCLSGC